MSAENPFEHQEQEEQGGLKAWIKGTRIAKILHKWNSGRYEQYVPEVYRELAEKNGIPKPNRWVPSAEGTPVRIPRDMPRFQPELIDTSRREMYDDVIDPPARD